MEEVNKRQNDIKPLILLAVGFLVGLLSFLTYRIVAYKSNNVHYHANFALYINGQREDFESFTFYEEVQACVSDQTTNPKARVHMHNQENSVVHVHDEGVTWGHFFANLGFGLTDKLVQTDDQVLQANNDNKLTFVLNGKPVSAIANQAIKSEDVLLISYGPEELENLTERFNAIPKTAGDYNGKHDPGNCSGDEQVTFMKRLRSAPGIESAISIDTSSHAH